MKFEIGKLYQLVSAMGCHTKVDLYPEEALCSSKHEGKLSSLCSIKPIPWDLTNGPFLIVGNNEDSPSPGGDKGFYHIVSSEGTTGWIGLTHFTNNFECVFKELKDDGE